MDTATLLKTLLVPAALIFGGLLAGIVLDRLVLPKIEAMTRRTLWEGDTILVRALRGMPTIWFFLAGVYLALDKSTVHPAHLHVINEAMLVAAIFSFTVVVARVLAGLMDVYNQRVGGLFVRTSMVTNLLRVLVYLIGILVILETIGISIAPLLTALGVGGLAVALGLQDTLSNLFAGINIMASKQVRPGDCVMLDSGQEGTIADITWRYTTVETLQNNMVIIPNSKLASAVVTNYRMPHDEMTVPVKLGVSYGSDLRKVEAVVCDVLREVCREVQGGVAGWEPRIRFTGFGDSSIDFNVHLRASAFTDRDYLVHEFIKRLHRRFAQEGIAIPFPTRTLIDGTGS
jgi:small-conductance mechanosensitive channel